MHLVLIRQKDDVGRHHKVIKIAIEIPARS